jgi:predicted RNA polymerase sigma factor
MMARVACPEQPTPPQLAALAPALPADAPLPIRVAVLAEGIVAVYSPAQLTRSSAWQFLVDLYGQLRDVTPTSVVTA